ncbi:hypothetical protein HID58_062247 [Brassica napus]|uniref:Uncharacterized protein n=1 Tax=Brassica napus TaxID=3708 RepID=A0ABQ8A0W8_BRANA|nr:hypothetical protein HID58_062247 [Brassica napus]
MLYVSSRSRKLQSSPVEAHQSSIVYGLVGKRKGGASSLFKQSCDIGVKASGPLVITVRGTICAVPIIVYLVVGPLLLLHRFRYMERLMRQCGDAVTGRTDSSDH